MRLLLVALLVILMPIRGWMGDAMAIGMLTTTQQAAVATAAGAEQISAHAAPESAQAQAHHHALAAAQEVCDKASSVAGSDDGVVGSSDCGPLVSLGCESCSACQACHSVALGTDTHSVVAPLLPKVAPVGKSPHFASVEPQPWLKPPIS